MVSSPTEQKSANSSRNDPIFIVGAPRSGTTLTATIIGKHSRIFMPGETHYFPDIYSRRAAIGEPIAREPKQIILARLKSLYQRYNESHDQARVDKIMRDSSIIAEYWQRCTSYKEIFSWFMNIQMLVEKKRRWGNQVPKDIFYLDQILSFYPKAKILVCVRDVHDFLLSYKYKWRATAPDQVERIQRLYHPVLTSLIWKSSTRRIREFQQTVPSRNMMIVRYEALVTKPNQVVPDICEFLGETFEPEMLVVETNNSSKNVGDAAIFSSSVGRWKTELSPTDAFVADFVCDGEIGILGYEKSTAPVSYAKILWSFATLPWGLMKALNANKSSTGPLIPYLTRRISALLR